MLETEILIVSDSHGDTHALTELLSARGYHIRCAESGEDIRRMIRSHRPDIVLLDLSGMQVNGRAILATLRDDPAISDLPIVVLTDELLTESRLEHLELGADYLLTRPFPARELLAVIARRVEHVRRVIRAAVSNAAQGSVETNEQRFARLFRAWLQKHYGEQDLNITRAARELGYSRTILQRYMMKSFRMPFRQMVNEWRVDAARLIFEKGERSVSITAEQCGFRNRATFSASFRKVYGCTPRDYIQSIQGLLESAPAPRTGAES